MPEGSKQTSKSPWGPAQRRCSVRREVLGRRGAPGPRRSISAQPCPASGPTRPTRYAAPDLPRTRPPRPTPPPHQTFRAPGRLGQLPRRTRPSAHPAASANSPAAQPSASRAVRNKTPDSIAPAPGVGVESSRTPRRYRARPPLAEPSARYLFGTVSGNPICVLTLYDEVNCYFCVLWARRDLNPRPLPCKGSALNRLSYAPEAVSLTPAVVLGMGLWLSDPACPGGVA